ncbi:MAG: GDP-mannose 4,6-dehydratase [Alphaproteobacteria bacterium]|nr:GDP-mannose 4,6-dehydratase [Alphaproteobacteria bacterium]
MRVLVTGGAGFIGTHLVRMLLRQGHEVAVLDDLSTGRAENIEAFRSDPRFSHVVGDVGNVPLVTELVERADLVYHLAAAVGVRLVLDNPVKTIETNVLGTEAVLKAAARDRSPVFLASSSEVYGRSPDVPFREDCDLMLGATGNMRWSYACSKAVGESLALAYHRERGLPVIVGRLFNTTGPGQTGQYGMVLPTFARQAVEGRPITVYGDGTQTRCFCHVTDTVRALVGLMQGSGSFGQVFNIGSTQEISIHALARLVRDIARSNSAIELVPYHEAYAEGFEDMMRRVPDTGRIAQRIGWRPEISLERLVREVVDRARAETSSRAVDVSGSPHLVQDPAGPPPDAKPAAAPVDERKDQCH